MATFSLTISAMLAQMAARVAQELVSVHSAPLAIISAKENVRAVLETVRDVAAESAVVCVMLVISWSMRSAKDVLIIVRPAQDLINAQNATQATTSKPQVRHRSARRTS